jgi:hypothetical protein
MVRRGSPVRVRKRALKDVIPICLTAVSSGDDDAAAAGKVFRGRSQGNEATPAREIVCDSRTFSLSGTTRASDFGPLVSLVA